MVSVMIYELGAIELQRTLVVFLRWAFSYVNTILNTLNAMLWQAYVDLSGILWPCSFQNFIQSDEIESFGIVSTYMIYRENNMCNET